VRKIAVSVCVLAAVALLSCSRGNPVSVGGDGAGRDVEIMTMAPSVIFGANQTARDCDVATVVCGPNSGGTVGSDFVDPWGRRWSVAAALVENLGVAAGVIRFIPPSWSGAMGLIIPCGLPGVDSRFIKVDACALGPNESPAPSVRWIEVAVTMQVKDAQNGDWDIIAHLMRFASVQNGFPVMFDSKIFQFDENLQLEPDDIQPDIAYDPSSGNLILVHTDYTDAYFQSPVPILYRCTNRTLTYPGALNFTWSGPWLASSSTEESGGFQPRLDIGLVNDVPGYDEPVYLAAVVYTCIESVIWGPGQNPGDPWHWQTYDKPHVRVTYWPVDWNGQDQGDHDYCVIDYSRWGQDAGLPVIDISPVCNDADHHDAAIAYIQCEVDDTNASVCFVNTRNLTDPFTYYVPPCDEGSVAYATHPSVALHFQNTAGGASQVSLSVFGRIDDGDWYPCVANLAFDETDVDITNEQQVNDTHAGSWLVGSFLEHNYGVNTALTVFSPNSDYWLLYPALKPGQSIPSEVRGAFGNTTQ
jgi:hypothetical protein